MRTTQHTEPEQRKAPLAPTAEWLQMSKEEREERLRTFHGDIEYVYMGEADRALKAKDNTSCQQWLSLTELPAYYLSFLKVRYGADFIRGTGFDTTDADKDYKIP